MSKAILVMDMPKSCDVCDFVTVDCLSGYMICDNPLSEQYGCDVTNYIGRRAEGCPLREVPQRKNENTMFYDSEHYFAGGYNACIDEIMKGSEENG